MVNVTRTAPVRIADTVTVTMSLAHAETLRAIFYRIGGSETGRRGHTSELDAALRKAKVGRLAESDILDTQSAGSICFGVNVTTTTED